VSELNKKLKNSRMLKNTGSWLYCDQCNKTVGYLCYTTYQSFKYDFECKCGNLGSFDLSYEIDRKIKNTTKELKQKKNRLCCPNDEAPLFTIVEKNIKNYTYMVCCNKCLTRYASGEM
jgi:hypothetical protein